MDNKGFIREHSKKKLDIYKKYLQRYLSVMQHTNYVQINIFEPFAGSGVDKNGTEGSALCSARIIKEFLDKKLIRLFLNELDEKNYQSLEATIRRNNFDEFTGIFKSPAKEFLSKVTRILKDNKHTHNFFYLDPHGYTQYSKQNLEELLKLSNCEYLFFIPTQTIYRFIDAEIENNPADKFLIDLGLKPKECTRLDRTVELINQRLKVIAKTKFGYAYKIKSDKKGNAYHLFFVTKHIRGAEKFLETKEKLHKEEINLFSYLDKEKLFREFFLNIKQTTNHEIYEEAISWGFLSKYTNEVLKKLEDNGDISVTADFDRRKSTFYLTANDKIITISWNTKTHEQN